MFVVDCSRLLSFAVGYITGLQGVEKCKPIIDKSPQSSSNSLKNTTFASSK